MTNAPKHHIVSGNLAIDEFCKAFGIDDKCVTKIVVTMQVNDVAKIEITRLMTDEIDFTEVCKKYTINPIPTPKEYEDVDYTKCKFRKIHNGCCSLIKCETYGKTCQIACGWMMERKTPNYKNCDYRGSNGFCLNESTDVDECTNFCSYFKLKE